MKLLIASARFHIIDKTLPEAFAGFAIGEGQDDAFDRASEIGIFGAGGEDTVAADGGTAFAGEREEDADIGDGGGNIDGEVAITHAAEDEFFEAILHPARLAWEAEDDDGGGQAVEVKGGVSQFEIFAEERGEIDLLIFHTIDGAVVGTGL